MTLTSVSAYCVEEDRLVFTVTAMKEVLIVFLLISQAAAQYTQLAQSSLGRQPLPAMSVRWPFVLLHIHCDSWWLLIHPGKHQVDTENSLCMTNNVKLSIKIAKCIFCVTKEKKWQLLSKLNIQKVKK